ncbi:MAG TPA: hypothetical protein VF894_08540 [Anaeromyxobacter sp.]
MSRSSRTSAVVLCALALAACSSGLEPTGCHSDDQCPSASRCQAGICTSDARPVAVIAPLGEVEAYALVQLDGRASDDRDGEDAPVEHVWTVRAVTARCAPPEVVGREPLAQVRFGCPGTFEVSLAVRDRLGVESAPAVAEVHVVPSSGAPVVFAGADVGTDHACSGSPLLCRTTEAVTLTASTATGLAIQWSVEAPLDRALESGTRRVRFVPGPAAAEVRAEIETDGTAISGDWIFRIEARDAYGVVGAAYTRVSVRNRAPVLATEQPAPFPHLFDPARSSFTSSGEVGFDVSDPDGDPIVVSATWRHAGDGGAYFEGVLGHATVSFGVDVPYAAPADALKLRGGAELSRRIELVARDVNRGEGRADVAIEIDDRPPVPAGGAVDARVPHVFDARASRYVATARLGAWTDPDGDPLFAAPGVAPCEAVTIEDGLARVTCSVPYEGAPAVGLLAGVRSVPVRIHDPWTDAASIPVYSLEILNQPPAMDLVTDVAGLLALWQFEGSFTCMTTLYVSGATFTATPTVADPDGDPVVLRADAPPGGSASPTDCVCTSGSCVPIRFVQPVEVLRCLAPYVPSTITASDGGSSVTVVASPPLVRG